MCTNALLAHHAKHSDNLVNLVGGCWNDGPDKLCIVLEFCPRGTLKELLVATTAHDLNHDWAFPYFQLMQGIASCFRYFHHEQPSGEALIHRDLKPDNVLIAEGFIAKVADLGASTRFDQDEVRRRLAEHEGASMLSMTMVGTPASPPSPRNCWKHRMINGAQIESSDVSIAQLPFPHRSTRRPRY